MVNPLLKTVSVLISTVAAEAMGQIAYAHRKRLHSAYFVVLRTQIAASIRSSADFQSVLWPICDRQYVANFCRPKMPPPPRESNFAVQQIENLRCDNEICAVTTATCFPSSI